MIDRRLMQEAKGVSKYLWISVALGIGLAFLSVAQAWYFSGVVASVFLEKATFQAVKPAMTAMLIIIMLRGILQWYREKHAHEAAIRVKNALRERLLTRLMILGPVFTRGERTGELVNTAVDGVESLDEYFVRYLPQLALAGLIPILVLCFVFPFDLTSGFILLITGPLIPVFMMLIGKMAEKKSLQQWKSLSRMSAHFLDMLQGLTTLKRFGRSKDQARVIERVSDSFRETTLSVVRIAFLSALVLEFLATISTALVAVTLGVRLVDAHISYRVALFLLLLAPEYYLPLRTLGLQFHAGMSGVNAANRLDEVMTAKGYLSEQPLTNDQVNSDLLNQPLSLMFKDVVFSYAEESHTILNHVSFEVPAGQHVALVGPSGAGKTSILQVLLKFIKPSAGTVLVNGVNLASISAPVWREKIAYVSQQPYLFAGSILDNIHLARPEAQFQDVVRAAELANAHAFIMELPQQYETVLGEGGLRLSGGQAQRIAIARAYLKDAPLLLLDEATSSLDVESEQSVQNALQCLMQDRTVIMIAHRLHTVYQADQIFVVNEGKISECGTHQALLDHGGYYAQLVREYQGGTL